MYAHETRIYIALIIAAIVLAVILGFYVITIIRQQHKKVLSYKDKIVLEMHIIELERQRIAADLHDELGSLLSAIKLNLQCMETNSPADQLIIENTGAYIDMAMHRIREISNNLVPKSLEKNGLINAVKEFCEMIGSAGQIEVQCYCSILAMAISKEKEIHIYRIIQEMINNTVKHSKAAHINLQLTIKKNVISLVVEDDGIGFDESEIVKANKGFGLRNIISRVDLLKGRIYLDTAPGKGVRYLIEIPL
jgi:signal transduction histidine kinase